MTILIYPLPELGHLLPTFPLAALLRRRGHRVVYATILDHVAPVAAHGFDCVPVLRDVYPRGHTARLDRVEPARFGLVEKVIWMRQDDELFAGRLFDELAAVAPRLILVDTISTMVAMAARERAIPCLRYSTSLSQRLAGGLPITSGLPADAPPIQRAAAASASGCLSAFAWQIYEHALVRFGYPAGQVSFATAFTPELGLERELVLPPAALELPGAGGAGAVHAGLPVDLDRAEQVSGELERALDGRPLIYVALGTQAHRYPAAGRLLGAVLAALRARPDWQAVVAAGEHAAALAADCPANVVLLPRAPQLWALRRAAVFVTHAGMGAMREAIALHVPMIAIPQGYDQPGNAARIEHHGAGVQLPYDAVDPARLGSCIERVLGRRDAFVAQLRRLDEACAGEADGGRALRLIEGLLEDRQAGPGRSVPPPEDWCETPVEPSTSPERARATAQPGASAPVRRAPPNNDPGWLVFDTSHPGVPAAGAPDRGAGQLGWLLVAGDPGSPGSPGSGVLGDSRLRAGGELALAGGAAPSLGRAGFTICPDLGHAVSRAEGSLLARVELRGELERAGPYLTGRARRCRWLLDAGALLSRLAIRWVEAALAGERADHPERAEFFAAAYARHRAGADCTGELERVGGSLRHRGYQVGLDALDAAPHDAARFARNGLILFHCRDAASPADYLRRRADIIRALDVELGRSVAEAAARAGIPADLIDAPA